MSVTTGSRASVIVVLASVLAGAADAQGGRLTGTVHGSGGEPLAGARIVIVTLAATAESRNDGTFTIGGVLAGTYEVRAYRIGYRSASLAGVQIRAAEGTSLAVVMESAPHTLAPIVASVSRRAESITEAPAAVTRFDVAAIDEGLGSPATNLLKQAPGIDLTQVGVMSSFANGRGFNKAFNSRWLTIEDGRVAAFPETGLPIGEHTTVPKIDLADIEVIAGPGSALYGANASGGVLSVSTRDPRRYPGKTIEVASGSRSYLDVQARVAGVLDNWGFKVAAQHQAAREWDDSVAYAPNVMGNPAVVEAPGDGTTRATRVSGSARYYFAKSDAQLALNAGSSFRDALGHSANGRYQIVGYRYEDAQVVFRSPRWFAQAYTTHSNSGDTYRLSSQAYALAANPALSVDSARALSVFPVDGKIHAAEVQGSELIGTHLRTGVPALDNTRVTWGVQLKSDRIWSYGLLYTDAHDGDPIRVDQRALYLQVETRPAERIRLVGATRYDAHRRYPSRWSPKVGVVFDVSRERVLRLTYNGAFLAPSMFQSDLYVVNAPAGLAAIGNADGFDIRDGSGVLVASIAPIKPEANETWELGFKGTIAERLYVDATVFHARLRDFMTQVGTVTNPFAPSPTYAFNHRTGERVEDAAGNPLRLFTSINVGEGNFAGLDASLRFYLRDRLSLSSATSLTRVLSIRTNPTDPPEATAFNTSPHRSSFNLDYLDARRIQWSVRSRYVESYEFRSGVHWGRVPKFATLGASASFRVAALDATMLVQADNVVSCVGGTIALPASGIGATVQSTYTANGACGFGVRHHEMLNMPAIGAMVLVGLRKEWR